MDRRLKFGDLPLRERKKATTRLALVEALLSGLSAMTLEEVAVRDLAAAAGISEATFFNYFPTKQDLLTYFIQVWSLDMAATATAAQAENEEPLTAIRAIYRATARTVAEHPNVMLEIIAHQARMPADLALPQVERGVRLLRMPDVEDPMAVPDTGFQGVMMPLIEQAHARYGKGRAFDGPAALLAHANVFFGVPLVLARRAPEAVGTMYDTQLEVVFRGLGFRAEKGRKKS